MNDSPFANANAAQLYGKALLKMNIRVYKRDNVDKLYFSPYIMPTGAPENVKGESWLHELFETREFVEVDEAKGATDAALEEWKRLLENGATYEELVECWEKNFKTSDDEDAGKRVRRFMAMGMAE